MTEKNSLLEFPLHKMFNFNEFRIKLVVAYNLLIIPNLKEELMRHVRAILYKFILTTAILLFTLGFLYGVSLADILTISALLTLGAYMIGDLLLLPNYGNIVATLADFGLVFFGVLLLGSVYIEESIRLGVASFLSALLLAVG